MARPEDLADDQPAPPPLPTEALVPPSAWLGPREFRWLRPGQLAGLPRPGIVDDLDRDVEALVRVGVTVLVTLEEEARFDVERVTSAGIAHWFFPMADMGAPSLDDALAHCARVDAALREGACVALHCRAGQGRTGTMLVSQLIYEGASAVEALSRAREIDARWVQSDAQVRFLEQLEVRVRRGDDSLGHDLESPHEV
jgi:atypical dual specificity phosphatase